ncbi:transcriptional regulator domain-containing protein [Microvirga sp. KLBC 81]|uniref:transcriptional regulator domain-containing protein n=1 Tax=Microvirga sp. KLBC 81 TaxID=1862707 RepID=UPI001FDFE3BE|nr:DUF6499 domain-containing protein [Microvirga sp. KLBC 81]
MKPDTSRWRDRESYDFFDDLPVEGLAWECLRRHEPYQQHYQTLVTAGSETLPLSQEEQHQWGLRFPGKAGPVRPGAGDILVPGCRPIRSHPCASAGLPARQIASATDRARHGSA